MRLRVAVEGRVGELGDEALRLLLDRRAAIESDVAAGVAHIIADVRERGDEALREAARRFDGVELGAIEVPRAAWRQALERLDAQLVAALRQAAASIRTFHGAQMPAAVELEPRPGLRLGRRTEPLRRVGAYAPGGRAVYPSSVLMCVVPARVAGVEEVAVCSPAQASGRPADAVLAACEIAGADRLFAAGGAGAVAALAFGTDSVPPADKVVGPGNAWVTEAKRQLAGIIASDCPAGPSELLVVADDSADADLVAAEMVAQAEHDPLTAVALVGTDADLVDGVRARLAERLAQSPRRDIVAAALAARGGLLVADDLEAALRFATEYAPEHLLLLVRQPRAALAGVRAAGAVFLGPSSSVVFGDYTSGTNHVLPTGGQARAWSGLSTEDFLRSTSWQELDAVAADELAPATATLAEAEGLPGHAVAARLRQTGAVALPAGPAAAHRKGAAERPADGAAGPPTHPRQAAALPHDAAAAPHDRGATVARSSDTEGAEAIDRADTPRPRPSFADMGLYDPGPPCPINLSDNTNRFGAPPAAVRALAGLGEAALADYPSVYSGPLKEALAEVLGVTSECIVTGCGSDDVIDFVVRTYCGPGELLAWPEPTFSMLPWFALVNGAVPAPMPLGPDFGLDPDALLARRAPVLYLCRPNNPTGTLFERATFERIIDGTDGLVLVDEAYAEFAGDSLVGEAVASERAVVLRTFSKAYGLAGLRVGYAVGPPHLAREIEKARPPYRLNRVAEAVALAALSEQDWLRDVVERVRENRSRLVGELATLGVRCWPSAANFVLFPAPGGDADAFAAALGTHGVGVRAVPDTPQAGDCVRVTIGPPEMMQRFLEATREVLDAS